MPGHISPFIISIVGMVILLLSCLWIIVSAMNQEDTEKKSQYTAVCIGLLILFIFVFHNVALDLPNYFQKKTESETGSAHIMHHGRISTSVTVNDKELKLYDSEIVHEGEKYTFHYFPHSKIVVKIE